MDAVLSGGPTFGGAPLGAVAPSLGKAEEKPMNEPTGKRRARRGESRGHGCGGGDAGRAEGHDVQVGHHVVVLVLEDGEALRERRLGRLAARQPP